MGTWGYRTFENDTALDAVGDVVDQLRQSVIDDLASLDDGVLERPVVGIVACLRALAVALEPAKDALEPGEVAEWQDRYLSWLDASQHDLGADPEFFAAYRANAKMEFDDLLTVLSLAGPGDDQVRE